MRLFSYTGSGAIIEPMKLLRIAIGFVLVLAAAPFLIRGGFSRYARLGIPVKPDWGMVATGIVILAAGALCIRPR
jgi:hypothetical protein